MLTLARVRMGRAITKENLGTGLWPETGRRCLRLPTALLLGTPSQVLGDSWSTRSQTRKDLGVQSDEPTLPVEAMRIITRPRG